MTLLFFKKKKKERKKERKEVGLWAQDKVGVVQPHYRIESSLLSQKNFISDESFIQDTIIFYLLIFVQHTYSIILQYLYLHHCKTGFCKLAWNCLLMKQGFRILLRPLTTSLVFCFLFFSFTLMDLFRSSLSSRYSRSRLLLLTYSIFSSFSPFLSSQFSGPDLADLCLPIPGKEILAEWPTSEVFAFGPISQWSGENHVMQLAHRCDLCGSGRQTVLEQGGF